MSVESDFRQRIGKLLREHGFFVQAIESETNPGMPDMYYRLNHWCCGWLELKHVKEMPKRPTTSLFKSLNHPLLTEQANWIELEIGHGGTADILVGYQRDYFLVPGHLADVFNDFTEETLRIYQLPKNEIPLRLKR